MTMRPKINEKAELADTRSMLRLRALRLRRLIAPSQQLQKVKQQILQRIVERLK
jgi:hypothetical protein